MNGLVIMNVVFQGCMWVFSFALETTRKGGKHKHLVATLKPQGF